MNPIIQAYEAAQTAKLNETNAAPKFQAGATLKVHVKVKEGNRERIQIFEGICIARKNDSFASSFTVRRITDGEGIERVFPLYSPRIAKIEVVRHGQVRRAKLYYLRDRSGKAARIAEKVDHTRVTKAQKKINDAAEAKATAKKKA